MTNANVQQRRSTDDPNYFITRREHDEFARRVEDEDHRQNKRIEKVEDMQKQLYDLTMTVQRMSLALTALTEQFQKTTERVNTIEASPVDAAKDAKKAMVNAISGAIALAILYAIVQALTHTM